MAALDADTVSSVYKQYKEDTQYAVGWLAQEANKCGYNLNTTGSRLKGKARKMVKPEA